MARALCWTALWDAARDAVAPAARYVAAVEKFGPAEQGIGVLLNVLGNATTAIDRYVPAPERAAVRNSFLDAAARNCRRPNPGRTTSWPGQGHSPPPAGRPPAGWTSSGASWTGQRWWKASPLTRSSAGACGTPWQPTGRRPRPSWLPNWPATPRRPAAPAMPRRWLPGPTPPSKPLRGTRPSTAPPSPTSSSAPRSRASTPRRTRCWTRSLSRTSTAWRKSGRSAASRLPAGSFAACSPPGRTSSAGLPGEHPVLVRTDDWLAGHPAAPRALRRIIIEQRSHLHRALTAQAADREHHRLLRNGRFDCSERRLRSNRWNF